MKKQYLNTSFNINPRSLGADRLWFDVKDVCREDTDYSKDYDGV